MSQDGLSMLRNILASNNHHITRQRIVIFQLLDNPAPQSMKEILARAGKSVDRVSVYRNIGLFEKLGIVNRVNIGWKYKLELADAFVSHHHHLSCIGCGKSIDIEDEKHVENFVDQISLRFGFSPLKHHFEIEGLCSACSKKPPTIS